MNEELIRKVQEQQRELRLRFEKLARDLKTIVVKQTELDRMLTELEKAKGLA